jgi:hypothetical protein
MTTPADYGSLIVVAGHRSSASDEHLTPLLKP